MAVPLLSILSGTDRPEGDATVLRGELDRALAAVAAPQPWTVTDEGFWTAVTPQGVPGPAQGWKLHLSATPASAVEVLARSLPVLLAAGSAFKFARTVENVADLNARHTPRGHSGKFVTVYPQDDAEAVRLAGELHAATAGLAGPRVLSDRPYLPGSLVHYRYGAFVADRRLGNDGLYTWVLLDPDGNPVEDRRTGRYLPPEWAVCPFPEPAPAPPTGDGLRLADRFLVRTAIRHVNKGGVYRAIDTTTGAEAIVKEARPHVGADADGHDVRDLLRAEAVALEALAPTRVAPALLDLFEQGGHLFLAEEFLPGSDLRTWVLDRIRGGGWRQVVPEALTLAERLAAVLDTAHRAGVLLRDLTPNNVIVGEGGQLRLIDLELAVLPHLGADQLVGAGTYGYAAPEQMAGAPATAAADSYSLGACLCFVLTGATPDLLPDDEPARPFRDRLAAWLDVRGAADLPAAVPALILDLMDPDPGRRPDAAAARAVLAWPPPPPVGPPAGDPGNDTLDDTLDEVIDGLVGHLVDTMDPADPERLWPISCAQGSADPCAVQLGAAGALGVLTRGLELTGDPRLPEAVAAVTAWLRIRVREDGSRPPGLYFGSAGIAWAMYDAGRALGEHEPAAEALDLAAALPVASPNPDLTHGTAGIALTALHLAQRSGDEGLLARAEESADALAAAVEDGPEGLIWGTPAAFDSRLAGGRYHGFAHGTAGIGAVLLATGIATGRADHVDLARRAGEALLDAAVVTDGVASWGTGPGEGTTAPYWCHGSAGIGTFLTRLHRVTGDDRFGKVAAMAAAAVRENAWRGQLGQCHGLAGNGEFLLDLAHHGGDADAARAARQLARTVLASGVLRGGRLVFADEERDVSASWAGGLAGVLSFLLRLRHGSARLWTVDAPIEGAGR